MKCPKCGYLGFEQVTRCRNCGYEFSLAAPAPIPDLALNERRDEEPPADLSFLAPASPSGSPAPAPPTGDLPLFQAPIDDTPLITAPSPPRTPLAVRRATPEVPRLRPEPRAQSFDLSFEPESAPPAARDRVVRPLGPSPLPVSRRRTVDVQQARQEPDLPAQRDAGLVARFFAMAADLLLLGIVDVVVVYFTMQICGLSVLELAVLPKAPMLAFLVVQNGGYFVAFTASGQTLGKMAAGIRVVTEDADEPLTVGRASLRTLMWTLLALPAGLGFVTALFRPDHRGLHDRFAGTRVVRTAA
jgi:uncharacterized RDD family membrane protein YckC